MNLRALCKLRFPDGKKGQNNRPWVVHKDDVLGKVTTITQPIILMVEYFWFISPEHVTTRENRR